MGNVRQFNLDLSRWMNDLEEREVPDFVREVTIALFIGLVNGSPVDTGRFRASWMPAVGNKSEEIAEEKDRGTPGPEGTAAATAAAESMERLNAKINPNTVDGKQVIHISNNLPYAEELANGSSLQAPNGWVQNTIDEVEALIESGRIG